MPSAWKTLRKCQLLFHYYKLLLCYVIKVSYISNKCLSCPVFHAPSWVDRTSRLLAPSLDSCLPLPTTPSHLPHSHKPLGVGKSLEAAESQLSFQITVSPWASCFPSLRLSFPYYEMGVFGCSRSCQQMASTHRVAFAWHSWCFIFNRANSQIFLESNSNFSLLLETQELEPNWTGLRLPLRWPGFPWSPQSSPLPLVIWVPCLTPRALWPSAAFRALKTPQTCPLSLEQALPLLGEQLFLTVAQY